MKCSAGCSTRGHGAIFIPTNRGYFHRRGSRKLLFQFTLNRPRGNHRQSQSELLLLQHPTIAGASGAANKHAGPLHCSAVFYSPCLFKNYVESLLAQSKALWSSLWVLFQTWLHSSCDDSKKKKKFLQAGGGVVVAVPVFSCLPVFTFQPALVLCWLWCLLVWSAANLQEGGTSSPMSPSTAGLRGRQHVKQNLLLPLSLLVWLNP